MKAIRVHKHGGPEVLTFEEAPLPEPGAGEARVKLEASGVNYIDIYHRTGLYPNRVPFTPGVEGAGIVDALGPQVIDVRQGDRVVYAMELGSYADYAVVPAWKLVPIPKNLDAVKAAAALLQGLTAHYLTRTTYPLTEGKTALVHAAAGGVGLLLVQMAKRAGATVLGTVSTPEKSHLAKEAGADSVIVYTETEFLSEVRRITHGEGLDVVYDSVGKETFEESLDCLKPRGYLVLFGQSSGPVPAFDLGTLASKGSLFVTRPSLAHYMRDRKELLERAGDLFHWIESGAIKLRVEQTFPLSRAAEAQRRLEGRKTTGKLVLIP